MFKSPIDFWPVVLLGMITTAIGVIFISIGVLMDYKDCTTNT